MNVKAFFSCRSTAMKLMAVAAMAGLVACGSDDDDDMMGGAMATDYRYEITLKNLSYNQPFSPLAVVVDTMQTDYWSIGQASSAALEQLAESGDNSALLAEVDAQAHYSGSGAGLILPAAQELIDIQFSADSAVAYLSVATMLVNSNDAFAGVQGVDLSTLAMGEQMKLAVMTYDAGTEANTEMAGTIPGPADGGQGFNADRDDVDYVAMHPGVVANTLENSATVLNQSHRFDAPVAQLIITRTQ